jgi:protein gp37
MPFESIQLYGKEFIIAMGDTSIQWTAGPDGTPGKTWNPLRGCTEVSPGCAACYAAGIAARFSGPGKPYDGLAYFDGNRKAHWTGKVRMVPEKLDEPLHWRKPKRIFVNSMSDLFHPEVPDEFIARVFAVMAIGNWHTYQVLTKRAGRMATLVDSGSFRRYVAEHIEAMRPALEKIRGDWGLVSPVANGIGRGLPGYWPLESVWLGVSVEDQKRADERIPHLLKCPAEVRFLSVEPMLGPIDLREFIGFARYRGNVAVPCVDIDGSTWHEEGQKCRDCGWGYPNDPDWPGRVPGVAWTIVGGESGPHARPFDLAWARSIRDQCSATGTPCFFKQAGSRPFDSLVAWKMNGRKEPGRDYAIAMASLKLKDSHGGDLEELPEDLRIREFPRVAEVAR